MADAGGQRFQADYARRMAVFDFGNLKFAQIYHARKLVAQLQGQFVALIGIPRAQPAAVGVFQFELDFVGLAFEIVGVAQRQKIGADVGGDVFLLVLNQYVGQGNRMGGGRFQAACKAV